MDYYILELTDIMKTENMIMDIKDNIYNFQYCKVNSFYDGDWKDAVIQMENPIYLKKSYYPFGEIYF